MTRPPQAQLTSPTFDGSFDAVVSPHHLASEAGIDMLRRGGNAVDAAVATNAVLGVVLPDTCGPGGDLFALIHGPAMDVPIAVNSSGRAGSGVTADQLRDLGLGEIPYRSPWSITVPGAVDGWEALIGDHGRLSLDMVLEPAIELATHGFPVSVELSHSLMRGEDLLRGQESAHELYPDGAHPAPGATLKRPAHAATLRAIAEGGREAFFDRIGPGTVEASNGALTIADLAVVQAESVDALGLEVFGVTGWTIPPNSQGYLTLATLAVFEVLEPPEDPNDPLYHHLLIEAYRSVAWERTDTVMDPSRAPLPPAGLVDIDRLRSRATDISPDTTTRWPHPPRQPGGTAFMTAADSSGLGVSLIQSNYAGIGSGLSAGATGVWLHNRGAGFNLIPGHPGEYAPGLRPLHTLSPSLWTAGGDLDMLLGTRGGDQQPQFLAQFAAHHYHAGLCVDDAQAQPRWNMAQPEPGTDSSVAFENRVAAVVIDGLTRRGHDVDTASSHEPGWGPISAIDVGRDHKAAADPRVSTSAALTT